MEGTIVYSRISKLVNILPTGLQAYILGGTLLSVGRKSHQNITLDGSYSYDPDEKTSSKLRYGFYVIFRTLHFLLGHSVN